MTTTFLNIYEYFPYKDIFQPEIDYINIDIYLN